MSDTLYVLKLVTDEGTDTLCHTKDFADVDRIARLVMSFMSQDGWQFERIFFDYTECRIGAHFKKDDRNRRMYLDHVNIH
jgi:hypothetical protein